MVSYYRNYQYLRGWLGVTMWHVLCAHTVTSVLCAQTTVLRSPRNCRLFPQTHTHICAEVPLGPVDWFPVPVVHTSGLPVRAFLLHLAELVADFVILHIALDGGVLLDPHHLRIIHHGQLLALHLLKICMVFDLFIETSDSLIQSLTVPQFWFILYIKSFHTFTDLSKWIS